MITKIEIFQAFQIAVFGYVVAVVLVKEKHLLHKWGQWLERLEKKYSYIAYPIGFCEKCFTGQIALWTYVCTHWGWGLMNFGSLVRQFLFVSFAIMFVIAIRRWGYIEEKEREDG